MVINTNKDWISYTWWWHREAQIHWPF